MIILLAGIFFALHKQDTFPEVDAHKEAGDISKETNCIKAADSINKQE